MIRDDHFGSGATRIPTTTLSERVIKALHVSVPFNVNGRMIQLKAVQQHMVPVTARAMGIRDSGDLPAKEDVRYAQTNNGNAVYAINLEGTLLILVATDVSADEGKAIGLELDKRLKVFYA